MDEALLGLPLGEVGAKNFQVIAVFLGPLQVASLVAMPRRPVVDERGMVHMPEQEDIHGMDVIARRRPPRNVRESVAVS